jgi:hypothetical protein
MASCANSPSKGLYLYPGILSLMSSTENASGIGSFVPRELLTLSNIYSNMLVL